MGDLLLILVFSIVIWIFGLWISEHFYKENGFLHFMLCAVFSLLTITVLADLFPQAYQLLVYPNRFIMIPLMFGGMLLGGLVIYLIDRFIPFGSDDLSVSNESKQQLLNVGMITSLAYAFYSITSGIVLIYLLRDHFESGVWMAFSLLLRALPLNVLIATLLLTIDGNFKRCIQMMLSISLCPFLGAIIGYSLKSLSLSTYVEAMMICFTIGVFLYVLMTKFLPRILNSKQNTLSFIGLVLGIILAFLTVLF